MNTYVYPLLILLKVLLNASPGSASQLMITIEPVVIKCHSRGDRWGTKILPIIFTTTENPTRLLFPEQRGKNSI